MIYSSFLFVRNIPNMKMDLRLVYLLEVLLVLRVVFAASLDEQCIDDEDILSISNNISTTNRQFTSTVTTVLYNSVPRTIQPTTLYAESTLLEVVTITPSMQVTIIPATSEHTIASAQSMRVKVTSKFCLTCSNQYYSNVNSKGYTHEATSSINIASSVLLHKSTIGAVTILSELLFKQSSTKLGRNSITANVGTNSCNTGECTSRAVAFGTNSTSTLFTSASSALGGKIIESHNKSSLQRLLKSTSSALTSDPVTSYHYFNTAGPRQMLKLPLLSIALLFGHLSF